MKRGSFFKSLVALVAAPSILAEIDFARPPVVAPELNAYLFKDLQLIKPDYLENYVKKYGNEDFTWWLDEYSKHPVPGQSFYWFERGEGVVEKNSDPVSVTVTINK